MAMLVHVKTNKCLTYQGENKPVSLQNCRPNDPNEQWIVNNHRIRSSTNPHQCLDIYDPKEPVLYAWKCGTNDAQSRNQAWNVQNTQNNTVSLENSTIFGKGYLGASTADELQVNKLIFSSDAEPWIVKKEETKQPSKALNILQRAQQFSLANRTGTIRKSGSYCSIQLPSVWDTHEIQKQWVDYAKSFEKPWKTIQRFEEMMSDAHSLKKWNYYIRDTGPAHITIRCGTSSVGNVSFEIIGFEHFANDSLGKPSGMLTTDPSKPVYILEWFVVKTKLMDTPIQCPFGCHVSVAALVAE